MWGIFDRVRKDFVSRSISHSGLYIGVILHSPARSEVVAWLRTMPRGDDCEVRLIDPEYSHRMDGCLCPEHRCKVFSAPNKFANPINERLTPMKLGVGALILRADGRMLAASRKNDHTDLGLPGGKVDPGETEAEALVRELQEETSLIAKGYQRVFASPDGAGYWFVTFLVFDLGGPIEETWGLDSFVNREGALVRWVEPSHLLQTFCSFREYNRDLFAHLGLLLSRGPD
jgi:8-oxo-dGTP pyrophosphatase MutT (NUDIX family)